MNSGLSLKFETLEQKAAFIRMVDNINKIDYTSMPRLGPGKEYRKEYLRNKEKDDPKDYRSI